MMHFAFAVLALFWAWQTLRYVLESYVPAVFYQTRVLHPLMVAGGSLALLWPDWLAALAAAASVGILVALFDRFLVPGQAAPPTQLRRSRGGLPPLP